MKRLLCRLIIVALTCLAAATAQGAPERQRVVILADMGNEPDEEQQMVHLLMYANELDIEGLCAVTGKYLVKEPQPLLFHRLIDGYAEVVDNLRQHASGWPEAAQLHAVVAAGQYGYGIASTGNGRSSAGSRLIEACILREDPRPLHVIVNAGSNTLAQALLDLETGTDATTFKDLLSRLRVYENGAQDNAGAWILNRWPSIHWIRSNYQTYAYGGPSIDGNQDNRGRRTELGPHVWAPYPYSGLGQHMWALEHLKGNHGPLMAMWPIRQFRRGGVSFLEGGGTIPWLRLLEVGLGDSSHPDWGNWGGRYAIERSLNIWSKHGSVRVDEEASAPFSMFGEERDSWTDPTSGEAYEDNLFAPVWRWREAVYNDFAARADWCEGSYDQANHAPRPVVRGMDGDGPHRMTAPTGSILELDASDSSDPDGDPLAFDWWIYPEPGTYPRANEVPVEASGPLAGLSIPGDASGTQIHLILEVTDQSSLHPMTRYRRFVIDVE